MSMFSPMLVLAGLLSWSPPEPTETTETTAETPPQLAEAPLEGSSAKWAPGKGIEVSSQNKRFSLQFGMMGQLQVPIIHVPAQPATDATPATDDSLTTTLVFRRARLIFAGNLFTPNIKYKVQLTASPVELGFEDGVPHRTPILDWYFTFDRLRDFTFLAGQYKVPYNHQRMLRVTGMQFVDRSAANNEFTMDRDIGFDFRSKDVGGLGHLRYYVGVFLGDGIAKYGPSDFGFMYTARVEILPFGQYDDLEEGDHDRSMKPRMLIGGAYAFIDRDPHDNHGFFGARVADGGTTSTHNATADLNFRIAGFSLESAFFWRKGWRQTGDAVDVNGDPIPTTAPRNGFGYFAQAGYLIPRVPIEFGARWGQILGQGDTTHTSLRDQSEVGGVLGYYFARHYLKLQLDYLRLWNEDIALGTDQIRLQLQATF
jgi:phosphate-selective porin OprO/OprP